MAPPHAHETDLLIRRLGEVAHGSRVVTVRGPEDEHEVALSYTALLQYPYHTNQAAAVSTADATTSSLYSNGAEPTGGYVSSLLLLELSITICSLRAVCSDQLVDITNAATWCLSNVRFSVDCILRPGTTVAIHRDLVSTLENFPYSRDSHCQGGDYRNNGPPAVTLKFDEEARGTLTHWFVEVKNDECLLKNPWYPNARTADDFGDPALVADGIALLKIAAECPILLIRAGPWKGLKNHGCTCYLNSLMQCLFHMHRFREFVYSLTREGDEQLKRIVLAQLKTDTFSWADLYAAVRAEFGGDLSFTNKLTDEEQELLLLNKRSIAGVNVNDINSVGRTTHGALQRLFAQLEINNPVLLDYPPPPSTSRSQMQQEYYCYEDAVPNGTRTPSESAANYYLTNSKDPLQSSLESNYNTPPPSLLSQAQASNQSSIDSFMPPPNTQIIECLPLILTFGWQSEDVFTQHDIQELNRLLIDKLEKIEKSVTATTSISATTSTAATTSISATTSNAATTSTAETTSTATTPSSAGGVLKELFGGISESYIECLDVSYTSQRCEDFYDLQLDLRGDIATSIQDLHEVEILDKDNLYDSGKFGKQRAKKGVRILKYPKILQFQLKRFDFGFDNGCFIKINDTFEYPPRIELNGEMHELIAVSVHAGDINSGHYYSYINCLVPTTGHLGASGLGRSATSPSGLRQWYLFDDESVYRTNSYAAIQNNYGGPRACPNLHNRLATTNLPRRTDSAYILFYTKLKDIEVDISAPKYQPMLIRLYLEQAYKVFLERRTTLLQSSFIIKVVDEDAITSQVHYGEDGAAFSPSSISSISVWESPWSRIPKVPTYLRPVKEFAIDFFSMLDSQQSDVVPTDLATDLVDRAGVPFGLYYLSVLSVNVSDPNSRDLVKIALFPLEYHQKSKDQHHARNTTLGQNFTKSVNHSKYTITTSTWSGSNSGSRASAPLTSSGRKDFVLFKIPLPYVTPVYKGQESAAPTICANPFTRQDLWRVWPIKVFDPMSLQTFFFGFAPRCKLLPNSEHFIHSIYSTLSRSWTKYRESYLLNRMSRVLAAFLDNLLDGSCRTFFCDYKPNAQNIMVNQCDQYYENLGWYELRLPSVLHSVEYTRIITLSFRDVFLTYDADRPLRIRHILGERGALWIPYLEDRSPHCAAAQQSPMMALEYYHSDSQSPCETDVCERLCGSVRNSGQADFYFEDPCLSAADVIRDAFTYLHVSLRLITKTECLNLLTETRRGHPDQIPSKHDEITVCVDARWPMTHIFTICAEVFSKALGLRITDEQIILSPAVDKFVDASDDQASMIANRGIYDEEEDPENGSNSVTARGGGQTNAALLTDDTLINIAAQYKKLYYSNDTCHNFLKQYGIKQAATGYSSSFSHLIPLRPKFQHVPISLYVNITRHRITDSVKIIPYRLRGSRNSNGLIFAIDWEGNEYHRLLNQVYNEFNLSCKTAQGFAYVCARGQSQQMRIIETGSSAFVTPTTRLDIIDGPSNPWLEVIIDLQPHFVSIALNATLGEVLDGVGEKYRSDSKYCVYNLMNDSAKYITNPNSEVLFPGVHAEDCETVFMWNARLVVTAPNKPKKQMTLN